MPEEVAALVMLVDLDASHNDLVFIHDDCFRSLSKMTRLQLQRNRLKQLPSSLGAMVELTNLDLRFNVLESLPDGLSLLIRMRTLQMNDNRLQSVPSLHGMVELRILHLSGNHLTVWPDGIDQLKALETLTIFDNRLETVVTSVEIPEEPVEPVHLPEGDALDEDDETMPMRGQRGRARSGIVTDRVDHAERPTGTRPPGVSVIALYENHLAQLPIIPLTVERLLLGQNRLTGCGTPKDATVDPWLSYRQLEELDLTSNQLVTLPPSIGKLLRLNVLCANSNLLTGLPEGPSVATMHALEQLLLCCNRMKQVPVSMLNAAGESLKVLNLSNNDIEDIPMGVFPHLPNLQRLLVMYNPRMTTLPDDIVDSPLGEIAFGGSDAMTVFPSAILQLRTLRSIMMSNTRITALPNDMDRLPSLRSLVLSHNKLESLGTGIGGFPQLLELDLAGNRLASLPEPLLQLQRMVDLDVSGNLLTRVMPELFELPSLKKLKMGHNPIDSLPMDILLEVLEYVDLAETPLVQAENYELIIPNALKECVCPSPVAVSLTKSAAAETEVDISVGSLAGPSLRKRRAQSMHSTRHSEAMREEMRKKRSMALEIVKAGPRRRSTHRVRVLEGAGIPGWAELTGKRPTQEDAMLVCDGLWGVFDGHGGSEAAEHASRLFAPTFIQLVASGSSPIDAMVESFESIQAVVAEKTTSGCTAVVAGLIARGSEDGEEDAKGKEKVEDAKEKEEPTEQKRVCASAFGKATLVVANAGDARATLVGPLPGQATRLSHDHKPCNPEEYDRIRGAGGFVSETRRVNGILAVARAIGDRALQPVVTHVPRVVEFSYRSGRPEEGAQYVVVACDGVWDVMSDEEVAVLVRQGGDAESVGNKAVRIRDTAYLLGSQDNISSIVIRLEGRVEL